MITMKLKYIAASLFASAAILSGCQADIDAPDIKVPEATMQSNTSIVDFKKDFASYTTVGKVGTKPDGSHYIIKGRVISSDATGNIYQQMIIQDNTSAILFSISRASLYTIYPVGQEIIVDLTGLYVGQYGEMMEIGDYYESGGVPQPGRMLYPRFVEHSQSDGLPNFNFKYVKPAADLLNPSYPSANPYCIVTTIDAVNSLAEGSQELQNMACQLVEFHNVHFQDAGVEPYSLYKETINRNIVDRNGNTLVVRNSGYSSFYNEILPEGEGTVRGLLTYYSGTWQLLLRSTEDVMFGSKGKRNDPYSITEVLAMDNNGVSGWAQGYIVGASKVGVSNITSADQVIFGNDGFLFAGNLLLAPSADCRDISQCVMLELPQGSRLREYANLVDNPDVLGHKMMVNGTFSPYLGMHGIVESPGFFSDFEIEGFEIDAPDGLGTEDLPYTCNYVINNYADGASGWVGGYVVGYVSGNNYNAAGAIHFELPDAAADYGNQNLVVAPDVNCTDPALCIVVKTSQKRTELGLKNNPAVFHKFLKVEGQMGTYLDRAAVITISNFNY